MTALTALQFDDVFRRSLPADPERSPRRRQVLGACFSHVDPTPVTAPYLIAYSAPAAALIDLPPSECETEPFVQVFAGNRLLAGTRPYAACYGGHQFGNWAGQLGDGRAISLGQVVSRSQERWELQLKGAGPTPYSRHADGRAVVRSSVREFLCSEAMYHLGVPTTRALSLVGTGESVVRDMFYDGNPRPEPGAVVCRMAPSFLRFGNFELFAARHDVETLEALARYTLAQHFPSLGTGPEAYAALFGEVCRRTAVMIAHWQSVGFVHGVMNTDNMSVLGLTIDYGPYGWLDDFDPTWTPNTTDRHGRRYRYGQQPQVALWNLVRFAEALVPLVGRTEPFEPGIALYESTLQQTLTPMLLAKLGLPARARVGEGRMPDAPHAGAAFGIETGDPLIDELGRVLTLTEVDMTLFFRQLAAARVDRNAIEAASDAELLAPVSAAFYSPEPLAPDVVRAMAGWLRRYARRLQDSGVDGDERLERMNAANPKYVLRNYLAQAASDAVEARDFSKVNELLDVLSRPYEEQPGKEVLAQKRPAWARHRPGCSMLSCSS